MSKTQSYIIAGMTILIVVLSCFLYSINSSVNIYKQQIELEKLSQDKTIILKTIDSELNDISKLSKETVIKSNSIIKKITYEKPKISDTTGIYMLEYIRNYRPDKN